MKTINIEEDGITEKRKKEIEYYTRHLLTKDDLKRGFFKIEKNLTNKLYITPFIMVAILLILILGLYFIK